MIRDALCLSALIFIGLYALTFGAPALHVLGEYLR